IFSSPIIFLPFHLNYSKICEIRQIPEFRGRYFGEAPTGRSATKRGVSAANDTQTVGEPREPTPNVAGAQRTTPKRLVSPANDTQTVGEPREPTPCVAGAQRSTPQRRICSNQRDRRNQRQILRRRPHHTKAQHTPSKS